MTINVFQGEREMAADNKSLGRFDLQGIPPAPRGVPQIEVTFDIDANGIVSVTAKDKATNKEQQIRIQASGGLSDADIQKMVKDAEEHAAEDKKRKEAVEARNQADAPDPFDRKGAVASMATRSMPADKTAIEAALAALKEAVKGDDAEDIKAKTNTLAQASMKLGEAMYKAQQAEAAGADAAGRRRQAGRRQCRRRRLRGSRRARSKQYRPFARKRGGPFVFTSGDGVRPGPCQYQALLLRNPGSRRRRATATMLKSAYRKLAMQFHPDRIRATTPPKSSSRKSTKPMTS